jgi:Ca2+-binding EF-hand superfamily protein
VVLTWQTGCVTREAFDHTLAMLGCALSKDEAQLVVDSLAARKDKLVNYEELYHLILRYPSVLPCDAAVNLC